MSTFTKTTKDGIFSVDLHIKDGAESFSLESINELAEILETTAGWIREMASSGETDDMMAALTMTEES